MPPAAIKFAKGTDDVLEILAVPFHGPIRGKDTDGEFFSKNTDLCLDWFPDSRPLLYHHGLDSGPGVAAVGKVDSTTAKEADDGWWVQAQLDKSNAYFEAISKLVADGKLFASSGAMPHLTLKARTGEILRWPWVELSLTPTPANLFARVEPAAAKAHYTAAGIEFTWARPGLRYGKRYGKALPDTPTLADGDDGDAPEGSYEDLIQDLRRAVQMQFMGKYVMVLATFPDYAVVCVCGDWQDDVGGGMPANTYYEVAYTLPAGLTGDPEVGEMREVQRTYSPKAVELMRLERAVDAYERMIDGLGQAKAGRVLSSANESKIKHAVTDLNAVLSSLGGSGAT